MTANSDLNVPFLSAAASASAIRAKQVSSVEAVQAYLERIDKLDPSLKAYITVCREEALEADERGTSEELEVAVRVLREHGFVALCGSDRTVELRENAELRYQLETVKRRRKLKRQDPVDDGGARAGRPLSVERKIARNCALSGTPYVIGLYIAKGIAEEFSAAPDYRKLKYAFDREYRAHRVNPPAAPPGWSSYSLGGLDGAGWPTGWEQGWKPDLICWICGGLVDDVYRRALMNGEYGVQWYPVHSKCGEEAAKRLD